MQKRKSEIYERADMKGYYRIKDIYDEAYMAKIVGGRYPTFLRSDLYHHRRAGSRKYGSRYSRLVLRSTTSVTKTTAHS